MKYLFLALLLTTGCSTMSDYEQGCRDGASYGTSFMHFVPFEREHFASRLDQEKQYVHNVCRFLEESRLNRLERFNRERGSRR